MIEVILQGMPSIDVNIEAKVIDSYKQADSSLSTTSTNPVMNKIVTEELNKKAVKEEVTAALNSKADNEAVNAKLTELSAEVDGLSLVVADTAIEFPKQAYVETPLPTILKVGRKILEINGSDAIILKPINGESNFFVKKEQLPYTLTKAVSAFFATTTDAGNFVVSGELETKLSDFVVKEDGKGLSSNDFTNADKNKLDSLQNYNDEALRDAISKKANSEGIYTKSEVDSIVAEISSQNNATDAEVDSLKESAEEMSSQVASLSSQSNLLQTEIKNAASNISRLNEDIDSFKESVSDQVANYKPIEITGNVTNAADEEDITSENNLLKLKNRSALDGMGYVILRKNKTFAEQVTNANTIYEIRYGFDLNGAEFSLPNNALLYFVGGKISNGSLVGNESILDAPMVHIFNGVTLKGTWNVSRIFAKWWEDKDNVLAYSISAMCSNKGTYYVEFEKDSIYQYEYFGNKAAGGYTNPILQFKDCKYVDVNLNGSTHIMQPNDSLRYNIIDLCNCEMAYVHDGILVGDRAEHNYTSTGTHEHGHGLLISGKRFKIERLDIYDMIGDAMYVGDFYEWDAAEYISRIYGGEISDCRLHNCRRQGISFGDTLVDAAIEVKRCHIYDIGASDGLLGTGPQSGIDIEPESYSKTNGLFIIRDTTIERCSTSSVICAKSGLITKSIQIENCKLSGVCNLSASEKTTINNTHNVVDSVNANVLPYFKKAEIYNSYFDFRVSGLYAYFVECKVLNSCVDGASDRKTNIVPFTLAGSIWKDCELNNIGGELTSSYPGIDFPVGGLSSIQTETSTPHTFIDCTLNNCSAIYASSSPIGSTYRGCTMNNCAFLGLHKCSVEDCTINNAIRIGSIYHDAIGGTFVNCIINEDFSTIYARDNSLILGGYKEPIKAIRSTINLNDADGIATKEHLNFKAFLSYINLNVDGLLSMANMAAYNSVIKGKRESYNGKGENNYYEQVVA